jgi:rhodanese-related sulfurtransferase
MISEENQASTSECDIESKTKRPNLWCSRHDVSAKKGGFVSRAKSLFNCTSPTHQKHPVCQKSQQGRRVGSGPLVIDLRDLTAFKTAHVLGAHCVPLQGLSPDTANGDLFGDAEAVHWAWTKLRELLSQQQIANLLKATQATKREVLVICYDGDASRLATSMLRSRGIEASSVEGGWKGLKEVLSPATNDSKSQSVMVSTNLVNA